MKNKIIYYMPLVPIVGLFVSLYFHFKHRETCIEDDILSGISAALQGVSFAVVFAFLIIL